MVVYSSPSLLAVSITSVPANHTPIGQALRAPPQLHNRTHRFTYEILFLAALVLVSFAAAVSHHTGLYQPHSSQARHTATMSARTLSLSAIAKVIVRFLFGEVQLPSFLKHYGVFFAGFTIGAVATPALYVYLTRNHHDRGKVQLAVFHILRLFETRADYAELLQHPEELLRRMEPEVMAMVDRHLTRIEAGEVVKGLKRGYAHLEIAEHTNKRLRGNPVMQRKAPYLTPAYAPCPRGFFPASTLPVRVLGAANGTSSWSILPMEEDDNEFDVDLTTSGEATAVAMSAAEGLHKATKDMDNGKQVNAVAAQHAPHHGSYGLDYDDFSSSSDEDDDLPAAMPGAYRNVSLGCRAPTPPTVVRKLHGNKCCGTSLSPIQGSPSWTEDLPGAGAGAPAAAPAPAGCVLPFASWTTSAELTYSSSTTSSTSSTRLPTHVATISTCVSPSSAPQETSSLHRENSTLVPAHSLRRLPPRRSFLPAITPFKCGRGRGRTGGITSPVPPPVIPRKEKTPGTRRTPRQTSFQESYGK